MALDRLESVYGGQDRKLADAIRNVRQGRTVEEENLYELRRFISTLEATTLVLGNKDVEGNTDALFQLAKERLAKGLLRNYVKWLMDRNASESFHSLITFLSEWIKIIESAPDSTKTNRFKMQMSTYSQVMEDKDIGARSSYQNGRPIYQTNCLWHLKERNKTEKHYLDSCNEFKKLNVQKRRDFVFKNHLCRLCLKPNHMFE